jgi:hypothetical protein
MAFASKSQCSHFPQLMRVFFFVITSTSTIRGESGGESGAAAIALVLASIRPFFFLFFGGWPPRFFG